MRRTLWVLAGLAVTAAVARGLMVNFGDLGDQVGDPRLGINGTIVYEANGNIRMVNPDGSGDGRVIGALNDGILQQCPLFSPDGLWLSHLEWGRRNVGLVRNRVDGEGRPNPAAELLTMIDGRSWGPGGCGGWSPDGRAMAMFVVPDDAGSEAADFVDLVTRMAIVAMDDRSVTFLPTGLHVIDLLPAFPEVTGESVEAPASLSTDWSPEGDQLAFATADGIAIADVATGKITVLSTSARPEDLSWSPDGQLFAYSGDTRDDRSDLFLINRDGTNEIQVTEGDEWESSPSWSPSGELALIQMNCDQFGCRSHIALYEDGTLTMLPPARIEDTLSTQALGPLVWSPDGKWILHLAIVPISLPGQPLVATPIQGAPQVVTVEFGIASYDWQRR